MIKVSTNSSRSSFNISRRLLLKAGISLVAIGGAIVLLGPAVLKPPQDSKSSTTKTTSASNTTKATTSSKPSETTTSSTTAGVPPKYANRVANILQAHGITKRGFVDYGGFDITSSAFPSVQDAVQTYAKYGFLVFPYIDISDGPSMIAQNMSNVLPYLKQAGGGILGPTYYWGYETQYYGNLAQDNPNDQEFEYNQNTQSFEPALAFSSYPGVMIDSPALIPYFQQAYQQIASALPDGYDDLIGISGDPLADHPVNYGNSGGVNMNSYVRFVNSAFYLEQVTNGLHSDGSNCALWPLVGRQPNYASAGLNVVANNPIIPPLSMYQDIVTYHSGGQLQTPPTGYSGYLGYSNTLLEAAILAFLASKSSVAPFDRTDIPSEYMTMDPGFDAAPKIMLSNLTDYSGFLASGGDMGTPWFNWSNPGDNSSNPSGGYAVATPSTVLNYFLLTWPACMHLQLGDVDTDPTQIIAQASATPWAKYSSIISKMGNYNGGFFGYENGQNVLFLNAGFDSTVDYIPSLVGHTFGWDSRLSLDSYIQQYGEYGIDSSLSKFKVIIGSFDSDSSGNNAIAQWVNNGGTQIILWNAHQPGTIPGSVAGVSVAAVGGGLGVVQSSGHSLLAPYSDSDINAAFAQASTTVGASTRTILDAANVTAIVGDPIFGPSMWIQKVGKGQIIVLPQTYYGESIFSANNGGDGLASGLTYLLLNAIAFGEGLGTGAVYLQQNGQPKYQWRTDWANPLDSNQEGSFSNFMMTVCGLKSGQKIVLYSNSRTSPLNPGIGLSKSFFGFGTSGNATDLNTGNSLSIGTSDIVTEFNIPAQDWTVLLL